MFTCLRVITTLLEIVWVIWKKKLHIINKKGTVSNSTFSENVKINDICIKICIFTHFFMRNTIRLTDILVILFNISPNIWHFFLPKMHRHTAGPAYRPSVAPPRRTAGVTPPYCCSHPALPAPRTASIGLHYLLSYCPSVAPLRRTAGVNPPYHQRRPAISAKHKSFIT